MGSTLTLWDIFNTENYLSDGNVKRGAQQMGGFCMGVTFAEGGSGILQLVCFIHAYTYLCTTLRTIQSIQGRKLLDNEIDILQAS